MVSPEWSIEALQDRFHTLQEEYARWKAQSIQLDMTRGKPDAQQLDLSNGLINCLPEQDFRAANGFDCRNYGLLEGLPEACALMAPLVNAAPEDVLVQNNSSLALMHDLLMRWMVLGTPDGEPWFSQSPKFLCPSPGYDRHFSICQVLGIQMIPVDMTPDGPDMAQVEALVRDDASIKGMWCTPKYSNPEGITYNADTVRRLAAMDCAAVDFRILWDNAYAIHDLYDTTDPLEDILAACAAAGHPDRAVVLASTSKISFPGAGLAVMTSSKRNMDAIRKQLFIQTIGPDKLNQLRHVRFFGSYAGMCAHMKKHAAILRPKFETVINAFEKQLGQTGFASWTKPHGGYFISLNVLDSCAARTAQLAQEAGLALTGAGATFPYKRDPRDRNLRIAPTFPPLAELEKAVDLLCVCVQLACVEKLLREKHA